MPLLPGKQNVKEHFDTVAKDYDAWKRKNAYYIHGIKSFLKEHIPPRSRVLEVGCGTGHVLAEIKPSKGVGIDISPEMIKIASQKYPEYTFLCTPFENFKCEEKFDYIVLVDVVEHVSNIADIFTALSRFCLPATKIILTTVNPFWGPVLMLAEKFGCKTPEGPHQFVTKRLLVKTLQQCGFSICQSGYLLLFPKYIPLFSPLANTIGVKTPGLNKLSFVQYVISQPKGHEE